MGHPPHRPCYKSLVILPEDGIDGDAAGEDLEHHEVGVGGHAPEELDPGGLVVLGVEGEREDDPDRREDDLEAIV